MQMQWVGNKLILCIWATRKFTAFLKHSVLISVLYSTECCPFHNFTFFFFGSNNTFFGNNIQHFKYQPGQLKVN